MAGHRVKGAGEFSLDDQQPLVANSVVDLDPFRASRFLVIFRAKDRISDGQIRPSPVDKPPVVWIL
jgi:hypothetical protein